MAVSFKYKGRGLLVLVTMIAVKNLMVIVLSHNVDHNNGKVFGEA